jgi:hypothetical protein
LIPVDSLLYSFRFRAAMLHVQTTPWVPAISCSHGKLAREFPLLFLFRWFNATTKSSKKEMWIHRNVMSRFADCYNKELKFARTMKKWIQLTFHFRLHFLLFRGRRTRDDSNNHQPDGHLKNGFPIYFAIVVLHRQKKSFGDCHDSSCKWFILNAGNSPSSRFPFVFPSD